MSIDLPPFEKDLSRASTLPARAYTDPAIYRAEQERIFSRTWQPVGKLEDVAGHGDFFTCEVAGEPIVVLRDGGRGEGRGTLRAFYNVCRHRAGPVADGKGTKKSLTCAYHGWNYALDGRLLTTPEFDGVQNFDKACHGLQPIRVETWGPLVFVNLDPKAEPLLSVLGDIPRETASHDLGSMRLIARREYVIACNWKVYVDNYLEGYHLPMVHPALYRELDYASYRVETFRLYSSQHAPLRAARTSSSSSSPARGRQYEPGGGEVLYYWVFPNWMVNIYPDNTSINVIVPLTVDKTLTIFEWYVKDPSQASVDQTIAFSDEIQHEDIKICEAVQKRLHSRGYPGGRFSVKRENGVHHFQGLVHEHLTRPDT